MDLRAAQETAAAARRQDETRRHQEEWMWSENYHLTISRLETVCALRGTRRSGLSLKKIIFTIFSLMTVMTMVTIFPMSMLVSSGVVDYYYYYVLETSTFHPQIGPPQSIWLTSNPEKKIMRR